MEQMEQKTINIPAKLNLFETVTVQPYYIKLGVHIPLLCAKLAPQFSEIGRQGEALRGAKKILEILRRSRPARKI